MWTYCDVGTFGQRTSSIIGEDRLSAARARVKEQEEWYVKLWTADSKQDRRKGSRE
jgi:hypothetical protein